MLQKLERKFGRYAIKNLMLYVVIFYAVGYVFKLVQQAFDIPLYTLMTFEPYYILKGQFWRVITWLMIPPRENPIFLAIMLLMYYQLGNALENTWGAFRFNLYILGGCFLTLIAGIIDYVVLVYINGYEPLATTGLGYYVTSYYVMLSIFLAFSVYFPDMRVLLYFIIPVKMKWMAIFYAVILLYSIVSSPWYVSIIIVASVLNFLIFWLSTRKWKNVSPKEIKRKNDFKNSINNAAGNIKFDRSGTPITRHRCAICGRTEADAPNLEFRYCSKCVGNFEYCSDHLFTHTHRE